MTPSADETECYSADRCMVDPACPFYTECRHIESD